MTTCPAYEAYIDRVGPDALDFPDWAQREHERAERLEKALEGITRIPVKPFPDPAAHSLGAWGQAVWRAWCDIQRAAREALAELK